MTVLRKGSSRPTPTAAQVKATAQRGGYTSRVIIECGADDYYAYVKPSADFGDVFTAIDDEDGTVRNFKGWDVNVRDLEDM